MKKQKSGRVEDHVGERVVLIAVKASREISRNALVWALTHVVQPGDCAKLLVVIPAHTSTNQNNKQLELLLTKIYELNYTVDFLGHNKLWKAFHGDVWDQKEDITESCSQMLLQLHNTYDSNNIKIKIKVISGTPCGVVAAEAKKTRTQWVVLDKNLKKEAKVCIEDLECNVVVIKKSGPKVLRLNLIRSPTKEVENSNSCLETPTSSLKEHEIIWDTTKVPNVTPVSSPEHSSFTTTDHNTSSLSSSDVGFSPFLVADHDWDTKKDGFLHESDSDPDSDNMGSSPLCSQWTTNANPITEALRVKFSELDHRLKNSSKYTRERAPLPRHLPPKSPPLCSICQNKAPAFGMPPKWFTFNELEDATDGFSKANFLAEGGFGSVHRGVLKDGRMVAVKQHKLASSQGDNEFFSEVEVLSCAQHRNVVMLVGFCVENGRTVTCLRIYLQRFSRFAPLRYNKSSVSWHNHGQLEWSARQKIAIGAARGLRYLHEECRVGCIVHRDMRPNNILLTHDFEVLVGDFGLARWQPDGETGVETRIIGTFGYLAPEYAQTGEITEKADVYSFGVVLVELITGRKAVDINRPKGQQYLTEWARPLLEQTAIAELIDPRLGDKYSEHEVQCMAHCALLCIGRDPHSRPRMSQVLWMLENNDSK
ncbi:hypothetical protein SSX86_009798 [Deinandra increscens subsp. villosa]|uniref:Protein kinase domain-containing protein n=1 Tax=Deinandra increscens subsp. villosa TaxID=3103831 RepID=A0AAP0D9W2_9ASTR